MHAALGRAMCRILVVDDDIDLLMLLERKLLGEGYIVETACSIPEAEEIIRFFQPHIILLDINVNGEDGRQLCWKLKHSEKHKNSKVIVVSGFDLSASRAVLFGADEMVTKPIQTEFLLQRIDAQVKALSGIHASMTLVPEHVKKGLS